MSYPNVQGQVPQVYQSYSPWASQTRMPASYQQNPQQYSATPVQIPQQFSYTPAPQPRTDIHWVQGASGAKAYNLEPGCSALLMDSEANRFYIKSTDQSGMPLPLRTFRYTEEAEEVDSRQSGDGKCNMDQYLTKDDFKRLLEEYLGPVNKDGSSK